MEMIKKQRYKHKDGKKLIEVRIKSAMQLFDAKDPAPFRDRDLDDDFSQYIISSAMEFSYKVPLKFVIYIEESETDSLNQEAIRDGIQSYFGYQIDFQKTELKSFLKRAQFFLIIGLGMLAVSLSAAQAITVPTNPGWLGILREGIVIFGWVSIWKPIELILFDWYPLYEKLQLLKKLANTEVEVSFGKSK